MFQTPQKATPKRKRGEEATLSPIKFSFDLSIQPALGLSQASEDGSSSPRSEVARKFRGLALEGGGGASASASSPAIASSADGDDFDMADSARKRHKPDDVMSDTDADADADADVDADVDGERMVLVSRPLLQAPQSPPSSLEVPEVEVAKDTAIRAMPQLDGGLHKAFPSINRLTDSKSRVKKKRVGSPPMRPKRLPLPRRTADADADADDDDDPVEIVDPVRAALTWHEDEITIYDPEDEDDDGTGINGIGFKPTPALAAARAMKRRQQMAAYRKREENEARARRSQRRRGADISIGPRQESPERKVRFIEGEAQSVVFTTV